MPSGRGRGRSSASSTTGPPSPWPPRWPVAGCADAWSSPSASDDVSAEEGKPGPARPGLELQWNSGTGGRGKSHRLHGEIGGGDDVDAGDGEAGSLDVVDGRPDRLPQRFRLAVEGEIDRGPLAVGRRIVATGFEQRIGDLGRQ